MGVPLRREVWAGSSFGMGVMRSCFVMLCFRCDISSSQIYESEAWIREKTEEKFLDITAVLQG